MEENKKNKSNISIIIIVLIALIILIILKNSIFNKNTKEITEEQINNAKIEEAIQKDNTEDIKKNIDEITIEDITDLEMDSIDKEIDTL